MSAAPAKDLGRRDVRMDGVFFVRSSAGDAFAKTLEPGNFSYCVMVCAGRMRLELDFPAPSRIELGAGDAVAVSGLAPHAFRSIGAAPGGACDRFERRPMTAVGPAAPLELVLGVAPNEALALGSLMLGPIVIRASEHPDLSRGMWRAVEMLEDEYAHVSWIDHNLVVRRLAEIMLINMSRRVFAERRTAGDASAPEAASRPIMLAINAFFRAPEKPWTLAELARAGGMSRTRFAEEFKRVTGQTPGRIISRMRLTAIARWLGGEALSIEAAAEEAGYSSPAAFVRAFQREFGETPARWRRRQTAWDGTGGARRAPDRPPRRMKRSSGQERVAS